MKDEELKELVRKTIEEEAEAVARNVKENPELDSVVMPEDSYKDLMKRVDAMENAGAEKKHFRIRKRGLVAAALAAVLLIGAGVGASGARLFVPRVEHQETKDGLGISIDNDDNLYVEITENEATIFLKVIQRLVMAVKQIFL